MNKTWVTRPLKRFLDIPERTSLRKEAPYALAKQILRNAANLLIASSNKFPPQIAKYISYPATRQSYVLRKPERTGSENVNSNLPIPPEQDMDGYPAEDWLHYGKEHVDIMIGLLNADGFSIEKANRILDFGCSSGRMIRWLGDLERESEIWGVDISAPKIVWCRENLSPPFNFATVTIEPHLPFEDRYFDFIYCGSVFTHIDDLAESWLLELKRLLRPAGRLYITVSDKHTVDLVMNHSYRYRSWPEFRKWLLRKDMNSYLAKNDYYMCTLQSGGPECNVIYDIDYLRRHWGSILKIKSITSEAYGYQTAVLMEK